MSSEADFELAIEAPFQQRVDQCRDLRPSGLDLAKLDFIGAEGFREVGVIVEFNFLLAEFGFDLA